MTTDTYSHDPNAVLDYTSDWSAWLTDRDADTISTATATVTTGTATITDVTNDTTSVTFWVSGATAGRVRIAVHIVTVGGREDDRSIYLNVIER